MYLVAGVLVVLSVLFYAAGSHQIGSLGADHFEFVKTLSSTATGCEKSSSANTSG